MAASRTKGAPVGSAQWIQSEREHAAQMIDEEAQELGYSVRNELEWLNEHLADVFSRNNVYDTLVPRRTHLPIADTLYIVLSPIPSRHPANYAAKRPGLRASGTSFRRLGNH